MSDSVPMDPAAVAHEVHDHGPPKGFWRRWVFTSDHKIIGIQFLLSSLLWGLIGGGLAMMARTKIAFPDIEMGEQFYNMSFTMHASVMIFLVIIPALAGGFGNYLIPLMIGARDMAFPTLNMLSYWVMWPAFGCFMAGFFVEGGSAATGWTAYPPLSVFETGSGQTLWATGVILVGWSSVMGAVNYITTIIKLRAPGMTLFRMPLTVWALFITAILQLLATPVLASAMICLIGERELGTSFFLPNSTVVGDTLMARDGGQPLLFQHMFWFYSHPAVYIMILPAMGMVSDILATFCRKPIFGYRPMAFSLMAIAGLGFVVWGHHMFMSGMNPYLGMAFTISTTMIALPSAIKVFNWLGTMWGGQIHFTSANLFSIAFVAMFIIGGLTGIFMASSAVDIHIHDTYFIVGHIHYVLFTSSMIGIFGGIYYWFPKMFGKKLDERLGKIHFWLTFVFMNGVFFPMHYIGTRGYPRRIADWRNYPDSLADLAWINIFMTICAYVLFLSQIVFFWNIIKSLRKGERVGNNPWKANSLEWHATSPPWHENFQIIPTVYRGPYEFSVPGADEDYVMQTQPPKTPAAADAPPATDDSAADGGAGGEGEGDGGAIGSGGKTPEGEGGE
ncbi:MAG: cbb3-type cytochrome c oxidase subunit I [Planctomycetota bacterium]